MSYEIELVKLRKEYSDGTCALDDVSLVIRRSKTTAIVGPSGSGKLTVLKIIAGLLQPTSGSVRFDGQDVVGLPPERRNIGMVFQTYALFPNMTVVENVEFGLRVRGVNAATRRKAAEAALETTQIGHLKDRRTDQISGGQQQRVALARAVVIKPEILLFDEPLSALDAKIRHELRAEIARLLHQFNITSVYVTHDQQEAMSLGDQIVVMDKGRIMQAGPPHEVYSKPDNEFVANFIGNANLFSVVIEAPINGVARIRLPFCSLDVPESRFRSQWPGMKPGPARLLCRPQDVVLENSRDGAIEIEVSDTLYLGDRLRITGKTKSGEILFLEAHNSRQVSIGAMISLRIVSEHIHLMQ